MGINRPSSRIKHRLAGPTSLIARFADFAADPRRLAEKILILAKYPFATGRAYLSYWRSFTRTNASFVLERWNGAVELSSATKIAVFSHFDAQGMVHDFVAHYLQQLSEAGFTVIFVSNAPRLAEETVSRLRPYCGLILRRANVGYDFGAYKDGISQIPDLGSIENLLLANDSVYGPFQPLEGIVARMDQSADVWGITDSWVRHHHLQSYFLLFNRAALQSASFSRFWSRFRYVNSKRFIISAGEFGLSRELDAGGLRCQALFPYRTIVNELLPVVLNAKSAHYEALDPGSRVFIRRIAFALRHGRSVNSMHFFWDYLITRRGCPFLKRELLRDNPERAPFIREWAKVVGSSSAYDTSFIARHLELTMPNRPLRDPVPSGRPYRAWFP